ncbi:exodeoxyribonuclease VII small subunit [Actinomyces qiguomingii]|uniref:exodeoxyribonuclease VII small subunit n=1 Tax=Actinomyces qiguomingii TaxID=2057800 RepID=UPI000CA000A9|nr:exodeoxyribonuclease VII small subunit [Actinomyces qiguomingii]
MSAPSPTEPVSPADANADVAALPYEQAREQLVGVVQRLEAGQVPLEEALKLWERGEALAARCQSWLDDARARLAAVADAGSTGSDSGNSGNDASSTL